jgi:predicted nucleotide-binding protein
MNFTQPQSSPTQRWSPFRTDTVEQFAQAVQQNLDKERIGDDHVIKVTLWNQAFGVGRNTIDELLDNLAQSEFSVFVFHPDDGLKIHGAEHEATRDNVILELGMFMGKLVADQRSLTSCKIDLPLPVM